MPIFDLRCSNDECGHEEKDYFFGSQSEPEPNCPKCNRILKKQMVSNYGIRMNGKSGPIHFTTAGGQKCELHPTIKEFDGKRLKD